MDIKYPERFATLTHFVHANVSILLCIGQAASLQLHRDSQRTHHFTTCSTDPQSDTLMLTASLNKAKALTVFWHVMTSSMVGLYHVSE